MTDPEVPAVDDPQPRARSVVKLDASLLADARAAVRFLRAQGEPQLALGDLLDRLVSHGLTSIRHEYNNDEPFLTSGDPLPRGASLE